ncbi:hypothetical protein FACS1894163_07920 [Spirochaetia bacterium]|nr:hypothetical protein FACS1894163_07920 [Spirochaetia bacterium]
MTGLRSGGQRGRFNMKTVKYSDDNLPKVSEKDCGGKGYQTRINGILRNAMTAAGREAVQN